MDQTAVGEGFLLVANLTNAKCTRLTLHFGTFYQQECWIIGKLNEKSGDIVFVIVNKSHEKSKTKNDLIQRIISSVVQIKHTALCHKPTLL